MNFVKHLRNSTMTTINLCLWVSLSIFAICLPNFAPSFAIANEQRKDYIVYMGALSSNPNYSPKEHHLSMLQGVVMKGYVGQSLIRSYTRSFNGFAAHLTEEEARKLSVKEEVLSIFSSKSLQLHTTQSWNFMGFTQTAVHRNLSGESDVIIGMLDTGIWPESKSFSDDGFGPIPKKWKGECKGGQNFTCNNKIIGARSYVAESCRDWKGHGTHTASTAAGNKVENASFYGIANGTARGGAPYARIAVYKVCGRAAGCTDASILAGFDDAIADGVQILSVSLGVGSTYLNEDAIAIGSFHAVEKGILVVQSVGNDGLYRISPSSNAPWLFSVAASNIDRKFITKVELGNGEFLEGYSEINSFDLNGKQVPVVYGADSSYCGEVKSRNCYCLDKKLVKGKIVMCDILNIEEAAEAGAIGLIAKILPTQIPGFDDHVPYAMAFLNEEQYAFAQSYYNSTKNPTMKIMKTDVVKDFNAPVVATFSSKGPNKIVPDILKPDISAPGVDILAAYSPKGHFTIYPTDKRSVSFNIISGTSMSCPHVAGAAAYVKSLHPDWSSSAIKSALMTTASRMNGNEFAYGAGHLDPVKAANPGILYEIPEEDYIKMLCGLNMTSSAPVSKMSGFNITCDEVDPIEPKDLNYPSMSAKVRDKVGEFKVEFPRTITNIGLSSSTYKARITCNHPPCHNISLVPDTLSFKALKEQRSFVVKVVGKNVEDDTIFASLEWSDGTHTARSPIVVYA